MLESWANDDRLKEMDEDYDREYDPAELAPTEQWCAPVCMCVSVCLCVCCWCVPTFHRNPAPLTALQGRGAF
jgi:hypothetical protein